MAEYTRLTKDDIQAINAHYGIIVLHCGDSMIGGAANSSFYLKAAQQDYVFTVFEESNYDEVTELGKLLQHLVAHNFPTTIPVGSIMRCQNKPAMLKQYVVGEVCESLDENMLNQVGQALAQIHQIPQPDNIPKFEVYRLDEVLRHKPVSDKETAYTEWLTESLNYIQSRIPDDLPSGLIHADLFNDNVLFDSGQLKAIIDFEDACYYYYGFDMGMAIVGLCVDDTTLNRDKMRAFLTGYEQIRPLDKQESTLLPLFIQYGALVTSVWRFWKYRLILENSPRADRYLQMMQIAEKIRFSNL